MLKNTVAYYLLIFIPIIALFYLGREVNSSNFIICLFSYVLIYRPVLDRIRLIDKGIITREKAFKFYFPGLSYSYFKELYLP